MKDKIYMKVAWYSNKKIAEERIEECLKALYLLEDTFDYDMRIGEFVNFLQKVEAVE